MSEEDAIGSPLFPSAVETGRIDFRPAAPATVDVFEFYAHTAPDAPHVEEITEYLPWDPNETVGAALDFLEDTAEAFREGEGCTYLVVPDPGPDGDLPAVDPGWAGTASLHCDWDRRSAEFGVWLRKPFWGHGLATESAGAMLAVAFERLDLELVEIQHEDGNDRSRAMIERITDRYGGRYEGCLRNAKSGPGGPRDMHRFTVSQGEYREATGGGRGVDPRADHVVVREE